MTGTGDRHSDTRPKPPSSARPPDPSAAGAGRPNRSEMPQAEIGELRSGRRGHTGRVKREAAAVCGGS